MGERLDYSGKITTFDDNKIGDIALWENDKENEEQPEYTGRVSFYGERKKFKDGGNRLLSALSILSYIFWHGFLYRN